MKKSIFDKIWETHVVKSITDGPDVLYIDRHLVHEVTSPQAFAGLDARGIQVFRPDHTFATCDHNVPTLGQDLPIEDESCRIPIEKLEQNTLRHGVAHFGLNHPKQGVIHIMGPEQGIVLPGQTIVCGDSHTATHGAFGCIAFGIGTSEVEMVLATQCLLQQKPKQMRIRMDGSLGHGVEAKDVILYIISRLTSAGATGYFVEYAGEVFQNMSMEERMTVCNMSIEMGARGGIIAPDETTYAYCKGRPYAPKGQAWEQALAQWKTLFTDQDAVFDREVQFEAKAVQPMITYGTNPGQGGYIDAPIPADTPEEALEYMGLTSLAQEGKSLIDFPIHYVFLGSCTNGRFEDFVKFAQMVKGKKKSPKVVAWLVPGSKEVEFRLEKEGIAAILREAGFELRQPGCSACLAMNADKVPAGKYAVSTSNRNFEGRQGPGSRTFLAGPRVAALAAITGKVTDPRNFLSAQTDSITQNPSHE